MARLFRNPWLALVTPTVTLGQLSPAYLDPKYWEQTFVGYSVKRDHCASLYRLGLTVGYFTNFARFRRPFDGFGWHSFPLANWQRHSRLVHRSFFLYAPDLTEFWLKKRQKHIFKDQQVEPADIYVPEVWELQDRNLTNIFADLSQIVTNSNLPKGVANRFFTLSALGHQYLCQYQPKSCRRRELVDLCEPVDICDYTLHQLETMFPQIYREMNDDIKRMHREERKRRKELAEKKKKREKRKAAQSSKNK